MSKEVSPSFVFGQPFSTYYKTAFFLSASDFVADVLKAELADLKIGLAPFVADIIGHILIIKYSSKVLLFKKSG